MIDDPASRVRSAFTTRAPAFTSGEVEALVQTRYGIAGAAAFLNSERDLTIRIEAAATGEAFILKIANAAEDPRLTESQNRALQHVARHAPEVPVPRPVPTLGGEYECFSEHSGERHVTRLLTHLPGRVLSGTTATPAQMRGIGTALGALARALSTFHHPAAAHEIVWDLQHAAKLLALTRHVEDPALRGKVETILSRFAADTAPLQADFRRQVVHNDFNPFNLLVDPEETDRLTGILDFGDLVFTPAIYDLAVAASYQVAPTGPPLAFVADLVSAYHAIHPVRPEEADRLFDLMAVRNAMSVTIAEWRASRYPENAPYIRRNHAKASAAIARCAELDPGGARALLRAACGFD